MQGESLKLVFLLSEGLDINGTELVKGIHSVLGRDMVVAGGLAGDGEKFKRTTSLCNDRIGTGMVVALGVYGDSVKIGVHTGAGWLPFGPLRKITKSSGNILYTLDEKPALKVYREFLGEAAGKLPSSALMFPLLLGPNAAENFRNAVRTILAVDDVHNSMRFAGDMPLGGEFGLCVPMNRH